MLEPAIVNPVTSAGTPRLGPVALMVASLKDIKYVQTILPLAAGRVYSLWLSRLYYDLPELPHLVVCGPVVGAPYAVMLLESLIAWGVRKVIFLGWCGALSKKAPIGCLVVPDGALVDEGVSRHYRTAALPPDAVIRPSQTVQQALRRRLEARGVSWVTGSIWTTDAIYRETPSRVRHYQKLGVLGVEMELSALFSVAACRHVALGSLLVVSDELFTLHWRPGFRHPVFKSACRTACEVVVECVADRAAIRNRKQDLANGTENNPKI